MHCTIIPIQSDIDDCSAEEDSGIIWSWEKEDELDQNNVTENDLSIGQVAKMMATILLLWQFIFNISNSAMNILMDILKKLLGVLSKLSQSEQIAALYESFSSTYNGSLKKWKHMNCLLYVLSVSI